jgi:cytochrome b
MSQAEKIKVWDLGVRLFHWSLVSLFALSYLTGEELETVHAWSGYGVIALLVFRVFWGFAGTRYARFSSFIYHPSEVIAYLKSLSGDSPKHYLGHNPAGGAMIVVMLISLALTTWSGLEAYAVEGHGPLAAIEVSHITMAYANNGEPPVVGKKDKFWEEVHEFFANFTLLLVVIHIVGVFLSSLLHGENLVHAMFTGYKQRD